jgi:hypothetical protein
MIVFRIVVVISLAFATSFSAAGASTLAPDTPAEHPPSGTAAGWLHLPGGAPARYTREIREISDRHGVSTALVEAVIHVESAFNAQAVSRKGAQGLMQLMPQTASALGVQNAFDPRQNIEGGVRHLRHLIARFPGDLPRALAAYNAGEGAVEVYQGIPPFAETREYVRKVLLRSSGATRRGEPALAAPTVTVPPAEDDDVGLGSMPWRFQARPALPLIDEARRASRPARPGDGVEREPIFAMLARMRRQGLLEEIRAESPRTASKDASH